MKGRQKKMRERGKNNDLKNEKNGKISFSLISEQQDNVYQQPILWILTKMKN